MSHSFRSNGSNRGFTLIEVLVAVAIGAVLLSALYATYFSVFRGAAAAQTMLEDRLRAGRFVDRFSMDIHGAYFKSNSDISRFEGGPQGMGSSVSFTAFTYPALKKGFPASGITGVAYFTEDTQEGLKVFREVWNPYLGERASSVILAGVRSFEVSYFNGASWVKAWDSGGEKKLPVAVRAAVTLAGGEEFNVLARTMVASPQG